MTADVLGNLVLAWLLASVVIAAVITIAVEMLPDHDAEWARIAAVVEAARADVERVLDLLNFDPELDTIDDLFPGTGGMSATLASPPLSFGVVS
jgi:hypothetical protein